MSFQFQKLYHKIVIDMVTTKIYFHSFLFFPFFTLERKREKREQMVKHKKILCWPTVLMVGWHNPLRTCAVLCPDCPDCPHFQNILEILILGEKFKSGTKGTNGTIRTINNCLYRKQKCFFFSSELSRLSAFSKIN